MKGGYLPFPRGSDLKSRRSNRSSTRHRDTYTSTGFQCPSKHPQYLENVPQHSNIHLLIQENPTMKRTTTLLLSIILFLSLIISVTGTAPCAQPHTDAETTCDTLTNWTATTGNVTKSNTKALIHISDHLNPSSPEFNQVCNLPGNHFALHGPDPFNSNNTTSLSLSTTDLVLHNLHYPTPFHHKDFDPPSDRGTRELSGSNIDWCGFDPESYNPLARDHYLELTDAEYDAFLGRKPLTNEELELNEGGGRRQACELTMDCRNLCEGEMRRACLNPVFVGVGQEAEAGLCGCFVPWGGRKPSF